MTRIPTTIYPARQEPVLTDAQRPEAVTEDRWHQPFSQPIADRVAAGVLAATVLIASSGPVEPPPHETIPVPAEVTVDSWHVPFAEVPAFRSPQVEAFSAAFAASGSIEANPETGERYWAKTAGGGWGDADAWAYTSGGSAGAPTPTRNEDVFFDANSGTSTVQISITAECKDYIHTGFAGTFGTATSGLDIWGDVVLSPTATYGGTGSANVFKRGDTDNTWTSNGATFDRDIEMLATGEGGKLTLLDNLTLLPLSGLSLNGHAVDGGEFDANGFDVDVEHVTINGVGPFIVRMGGGLWTLHGHHNVTPVWWESNASSTTFVDGSTIRITSASSGSRVIIDVNGKTFANLENARPDGAAEVRFDNGGTFNTIDIAADSQDNQTIHIEQGTTLNVSSFLNSGGTGHTLDSTDGATQHTISDSSGSNQLTNTTISNSIATGGAKFFALYTRGNINGGNNTGWIFGQGGPPEDERWKEPPSFSDANAAYRVVLLTTSGETAPPVYPTLPAPEVTVDSWHVALSEPTPPKAGLETSAQQHSVVDPWLLTQPEAVSLDRWLQPLNEPVPPKISVATASQQFFSTDTESLTQPEEVTVDRWLIALSEPAAYLKLRGLGAELQRPFTVDSEILTQLEEVSLDRWLVPLSEPLFAKAPLVDLGGRIDELSAEIVPPPPAPELSWFSPLGEPTPPKSALHASLQQHTVIDPEILTQPEAVSIDKWLVPLSEPTPPLAGLLAAQQKFLFAPEVTPVETLIPADWFVALAEPLFGKAPLPDLGGQTFELSAEIVPEVVTVDKWFAAFSEPLHPLPGLGVASQQTLTIDTDALTNPESVTIDRWLVPLAEPLFAKAPLVDLGGIVAEFGFQVAPEIITADKWLRPFVEVPKAPAALSTALRSTTTVDPEILTQPEQTFADSWFEWLSEPLHSKPGLSAALQLTQGESLEPIAPAAPEWGWFAALSQPYFDRVQINAYGYAAYATISPPSIVGEYCPFPVFVPMYDFPVAVTGDMEDTAVAVVAPMTDQLPITNPDHQGEAVSADLGPDQVIVIVELC